MTKRQICGNYLNFLQFPNLKKNSFLRNYIYEEIRYVFLCNSSDKKRVFVYFGKIDIE